MQEVAVLNKGSSFGEVALACDKPRTATIQCKTDEWYFAVLERADFKNLYSKSELCYKNVKILI